MKYTRLATSPRVSPAKVSRPRGASQPRSRPARRPGGAAGLLHRVVRRQLVGGDGPSALSYTVCAVRPTWPPSARQDQVDPAAFNVRDTPPRAAVMSPGENDDHFVVDLS